MRNKTEPRTRKQTASSPNDSGLIVGANAPTQSARAKPALDNRSHRTLKDRFHTPTTLAFLAFHA